MPEGVSDGLYRKPAPGNRGEGTNRGGAEHRHKNSGFHVVSGKFTCVNAGHNPPRIKRGDGFDWFRIKRGLVLGAIEDIFYKEDETLLLPGDMLYLYTDGVTEAVNSEEELFGEGRLMEAALT
ncbi:MAG: serine/threonine-protein phosphatase [Treponema sp.]|nr:serine/threonine-protein phosphatase [Treponema sp.]